MQKIKLSVSRQLLVRVPDWADMMKVQAHAATGESVFFAMNRRWLDFGPQASGTQIVVSYPMVTRKTVERVGGGGENMEWCKPGKKRTFTATWRGNRVVDLQPRGKYLPIFSAK